MTVDDPDGDARGARARLGLDLRPDRRGLPRRSARPGASIAQAHLRHLNPFPADLGEVLARYDKVVIPEMNLGQLAMLIRAKYLVDAISVTQVRGLPFKADELAEMLQGVIEHDDSTTSSDRMTDSA